MIMQQTLFAAPTAHIKYEPPDQGWNKYSKAMSTFPFKAEHFAEMAIDGARRVFADLMLSGRLILDADLFHAPLGVGGCGVGSGACHGHFDLCNERSVRDHRDWWIAAMMPHDDNPQWGRLFIYPRNPAWIVP